MEMINHLLENSIDSKRFIDMVTSPSLAQKPTRQAALEGSRVDGENRTQRRARIRAEYKAAIRAKKSTAIA